MTTVTAAERAPRSNVAFRVALVLAAIEVAEAAGSVWLGLARGPVRGFSAYGFGGAATDLAFAPFAVMAAVIARRQPRNRFWVLLAVAGLTNITFSQQYAAFGTARPGLLPWVPLAAWISDWSGQIGIATAGLGVLWFPSGHLPSRRWRWLGAIIALNVTIGFFAGALLPGPVGTGPGSPNNPIGIPALHDLVYFLGNGSWMLSLLLLIVAFVSMVVRFRRATGDERQQLKWFALLVGLLPPGLILSSVYSAFNGQDSTIIALTTALTALGIAGFPVGIAIAIVKYRLYDIDVFISRALVYGSLAVFITAVYVGIAVGIGTLVGSGGKPNLGLSILATAIVAVGFQPVRERVQRVANRLVYGTRATPYEVLSQFSERVAESYASEDVLPRMARVLQEGTGAESATVWLRTSEELRPAASFPDLVAAHQAVAMRNGTLPAFPGATRSVAVRHQGEVLGALTVSKRRGEALSPIEQKLVDDLAHQAGLVLKNVGLSADLQARLVDLRASRQRLVAAQDDERRKLERNLHDGAQQHLVAIKVKLGLAEMLASRDPERARATVAELKHDADEALETLRDLARGIYPPLLADRGLPTALQAQARKATLPVTIEADGIGRYSQDTEAALYFCILEALQNIQKYAQASSAVVRLREDGDRLSVEVADDGRGFDVAATSRGNGLTNMEDRLDALGGTLHIASSPGNGTTLRAILLFARAVSTRA